MEEEIKKIGDELMKIMKSYQKCTTGICMAEKMAIVNDTNKKAPKIDMNIIIEKDNDKKEQKLKELSEYHLNFNHFKCNYSKCSKILKKLIRFIITMAHKKKSIMKMKMTPIEEAYFKDLDLLLKKQKLNDNELKKLSFTVLKTSFNII